MTSYRRIAQLAGKVWKDHGALDYKECIGDDLKVKCGLPFPRLAKMMDPKKMPFDCNRMTYGGFEVIVDR